MWSSMLVLQSFSDHAFFTCCSLCGLLILLLYVDNMIIVGDDVTFIAALKKHL